jgi:penicillin-binding protein 1A
MVEAGIVAKSGHGLDREGTAPPPSPGRTDRYFADWISEQLADLRARRPRLTVTTTLDVGAAGPGELRSPDAPRDGPKAAVSQERWWRCRPTARCAMVGGRDYGEPVQSAAQAQRQPGSAFKPFVISPSEGGLRPSDPSSTLRSASATGNRAAMPGRHQAETLAEGWHNRSTRLRCRLPSAPASARSCSGAPARRFLRLAPEMSLALGTGEVNLVELVAAYAPFANGSAGVWPYGPPNPRQTEVVFRRTGSGAGRVMSPNSPAR